MKKEKIIKQMIKEVLVDDLLLTFVVVVIILVVGVYTPWIIYKALESVSAFLLQHMEIAIGMYGIALYSAFALPKRIKIKKMKMKVNTIITTIVTMPLILISVKYWWMIPLLAFLISITYVRNKHVVIKTVIEVQEIPYVEDEVEEKDIV